MSREISKQQQNAAQPENPGSRAAGKKRRLPRWPFVVIVIALAVGCGALWVNSRIQPPAQTATQPAADTPAAAVTETDPGSAPSKELGVRDGVYTIMLIGQRDGNTDTLMAAMLDTDKGEMNIVSIPRDTVVDFKRRIPKINGAYNSVGGGDDGIQELLDEMQTLLGYRPANYACVNMQGFVDLVDAIGGVKFNVPVRMYKPAEGIDLQPGEQVLDGKNALALVRYRGYTSNLMSEIGINHDDFGRMQMQQMFLKALAEQTLTQDNIGKIPQFIKIASDNLVTDLSTGNIAWFAGQVKKMGTANLHFYTLPTSSVDYQGSEAAHGYYENIVPDEALAMINSYLNPFNTAITEDMVDYRTLG